ncbi:MAG: 30S ribosome-binding factor RbfA [Clostridia bacterium]|nr:30S ribosome-binding factor RbfA [Clostridia bacterium]
MRSIAKERINADLYRALSSILMTKVNHPALRGATILRTELSDDGSVCDIYVTDHLTEFRQATGFFRSEAAKLVNLRRMPRLVFIQDKGQDNADRVNQLLAEIARGKKI